MRLTKFAEQFLCAFGEAKIWPREFEGRRVIAPGDCLAFEPRLAYPYTLIFEIHELAPTKVTVEAQFWNNVLAQVEFSWQLRRIRGFNSWGYPYTHYSDYKFTWPTIKPCDDWTIFESLDLRQMPEFSGGLYRLGLERQYIDGLEIFSAHQRLEMGLWLRDQEFDLATPENSELFFSPLSVGGEDDFYNGFHLWPSRDS